MRDRRTPLAEPVRRTETTTLNDVDTGSARFENRDKETQVIQGSLKAMYTSTRAQFTGLGSIVKHNLRALSADPLGKTLLVVMLLVLAGIALVITALTLRYVNPLSQINISAFDIFDGDATLDRPGGKALADFFVEDIQNIINQSNALHGNAFSSKKNFASVPDAPRIPVDTSYGIEIKGISLDEMVASWKHLRYKEFQISGDLLIGPNGSHALSARFVSNAEAQAFTTALPRMDPKSISIAVAKLSLQLVKAMHPETAARYLIATAYQCTFQCGDEVWRSAIAFCWQWARDEPMNARAFYYLGYALANTEHRRDALPYLDHAIELDGRLDGPYIAKGNVLNSVSGGFALDRARLAYETAYNLDNTPNPLVNLGLLEAEQGRFEQAVSYENKAVSLDPLDVGAYLNIGNFKVNGSHWSEAADAFRKAYLLAPERFSPFWNLVLAMAKAGKIDEALAECDAASRLAPSNERATVARAMVLRIAKQPARAIEELSGIGGTSGYAWIADEQRALALLDQNNYSAASRHIRPLAESAFAAGIDHIILAAVLKAQGLPSDSAAQTRLAIDISPENRYVSIGSL